MGFPPAPQSKDGEQGRRCTLMPVNRHFFKYMWRPNFVLFEIYKKSNRYCTHYSPLNCILSFLVQSFSYSGKKLPLNSKFVCAWKKYPKSSKLKFAGRLIHPKMIKVFSILKQCNNSETSEKLKFSSLIFRK
jgi:hypothetical protein